MSRSRKDSAQTPHYKRPRPQGCWAECGVDCWKEKLGLCLTESKLHKHDLPPPNEYVTTIRELQYGRRDYDAEIVAYGKAITAWHASGERGPRPPSWRVAARDPYAGTRIWQYPGPKDFSFGFEPYTLWVPEALEECLFASPDYVRAVHTAGTNGFANLMEVSRAVRRVFATTFQEVTKTWWEAERAHLIALCKICTNRKPWLDTVPNTFDFHWKIAFDLFGEASLLVAQWSAMSYSNYEDTWAALIVTHMGDEIKARWESRISDYTKQEAYALGHRVRPKKYVPPVQESSHEREQPARTESSNTASATSASTGLLIPRKRYVSPATPAQGDPPGHP